MVLASLLPSSAHQLHLQLSRGAVFAAEDDDVDGVVGVDDDCDVYVDGTTLLQEIGCTRLKSFSTLIAITQVQILASNPCTH